MKNFLTFNCFVFSRNVRQTWITSVRHGTPKWISCPQNGPSWKCWTLYFCGLQSGPFHVQPMSHTTQSLLAQQFYNPLQKVMNQKNTNMKGNLFRGIDNCSEILVQMTNVLSFYGSKMILDSKNHFGRVPIVFVGSNSFWSGPMSIHTIMDRSKL